MDDTMKTPITKKKGANGRFIVDISGDPVERIISAGIEMSRKMKLSPAFNPGETEEYMFKYIKEAITYIDSDDNLSKGTWLIIGLLEAQPEPKDLMNLSEEFFSVLKRYWQITK